MFYDPIIKDHLQWLNDRGRNQFYKTAIQNNCKDKICVDVGAGTGILTDYALEGGAKKVYCVEIRKARTNYLKEKYQGKNVEVIAEDFLKTNINDADIFFLEQIGCQFNNDFSIKKFMSHIKLNAQTIPNRYVLKAYIYDGIINDSPNVLIDSDILPKQFYNDAQKLQTIKPVETMDVYEINRNNANEHISFKIDLTHYKDCTVLLDDEVYFNDARCDYENTYRDWANKPYTLHIKDSKQIYEVFWNKEWLIKKV